MAKSAKRPHTGLLAKVVILGLLVAMGWQLYDLREQVADAEAEKARYTAEVQKLQEENGALADDIEEGLSPEKIEELARDELGLVTPGEYVFYETSN